MTNLCAIQGQLVDVRNVGLHKYIQLRIHVPAEYAMQVMNAFGWATMADPIPVAIARLNGADTSSTTSKGGETQASDATGASVRFDPPRRSHTLFSRRAGMLARDPKFWRFCQEDGCLVSNEREAAEHIRKVCDVQSRSEILPGTIAEQRFNLIMSGYEAWKLGPTCGIET